MNPYDVDYKKFKESKVITDPKVILKLNLAARFADATEGGATNEIIKMTSFHKSDLSRLRISSVDRFFYW